MKIAAREIDGGSTGSSYSHLRSELTFGLSAQIHIKAWNRSSDRVYGTTIHELAHAAHSVVGRGSYDNLVRDAYTFPIQSDAVDNNKRLLETWASTVEIMFAVERYKNKFGQANYSYFSEFQKQSILGERYYTSAGYDLIDNFNQRLYGSFYPIDRVSGYTIKQIEDGLKGAKSWGGLEK